MRTHETTTARMPCLLFRVGCREGAGGFNSVITSVARDDTCMLSQTEGRNVMRITSSAFSDGQTIPAKYTCDGSDVIPPLDFDDIPPRAVTLALIMDDPDAPMGTWDHWVIWNMPPQQHHVAEGKEPQGIV